MTRKPVKIEKVHPCDDNNQVVTITGGGGSYRRTPCEECPWRLDAPVGAFPAEAYRASASTAYDMAQNTFACHMQGKDKPATCASFLLIQGYHNLAVRLQTMSGRLDIRKVSSPVPLYPTYAAMAIANGVDPDDPVLRLCRDNEVDRWT